MLLQRNPRKIPNNITERERQVARIVQQAYRQPRNPVMFFEGQELKYNPQLSNEFIATYDATQSGSPDGNNKFRIVGCRGVQSLQNLFSALSSAVLPVRSLMGDVEKYCKILDKVFEESFGIRTIAGGHSLGSFALAECSTRKRNNILQFYFFSPYEPISVPRVSQVYRAPNSKIIFKKADVVSRNIENYPSKYPNLSILNSSFVERITFRNHKIESIINYS